MIIFLVVCLLLLGCAVVVLLFGMLHPSLRHSSAASTTAQPSFSDRDDADGDEMSEARDLRPSVQSPPADASPPANEADQAMLSNALKEQLEALRDRVEDSHRSSQTSYRLSKADLSELSEAIDLMMDERSVPMSVGSNLEESIRKEHQ